MPTLDFVCYILDLILIYPSFSVDTVISLKFVTLSCRFRFDTLSDITLIELTKPFGTIASKPPPSLTSKMIYFDISNPAVAIIPPARLPAIYANGSIGRSICNNVPVLCDTTATIISSAIKLL